MKILKNLASKLGPDFDISNQKTVDDNLLKFEIFFEDLFFQSQQELEEYPVSLMSFMSRKVEQNVAITRHHLHPAPLSVTHRAFHSTLKYHLFKNSYPDPVDHSPSASERHLP